MWNPEPRVAEEKGRGWSGEGRLVWVGGSRRGSKWRKMLDHDCNKKERGPERRRRAIRPATVIRFHLNLWTLNDFPWVETACQRCVCVSVCVCVCKRKTKRVCPRLHQQFKPLISPPQHPSVLHPVLFTPHLFSSISPPPGHHPAVSPGRLFTLPGRRSKHSFFSVCLKLFYWSFVS